MSSLPHPEGVAEVVALLARVDALDAEIETLRPKAERFNAAQAEVETLRRRLPELLRSMDVESKGNMGWERRMGWFLAEMRRQLLPDAKLCGCNLHTERHAVQRGCPSYCEPPVR